jgi:hypothetical protein
MRRSQPESYPSILGRDLLGFASFSTGKVPLHFREYACGLFEPAAGISQRLIYFVPKDYWPRLLVGVKDPGGLFERLVNVSMLD